MGKKYKVSKYTVHISEALSCLWLNEDNQNHRECGPSVIWSDGGKEWWLKGELIMYKLPDGKMYLSMENFFGYKRCHNERVFYEEFERRLKNV